MYAGKNSYILGHACNGNKFLKYKKIILYSGSWWKNLWLVWDYLFEANGYRTSEQFESFGENPVGEFGRVGP